MSKIDTIQEIVASLEKSFTYDAYLQKKASPDISAAVSKLNNAMALLNELGREQDANYLKTIIESLNHV